MAHFGDLQNDIYLRGLIGERPSLPVEPSALAAAAEQACAEQGKTVGWDYIAGGASTERSVRANAAGFARWGIVPRMLRQVTERDLSVELFGRRLAAPVLTGPVGALGTVHEKPESAVVAATDALGIGAVVTTMSEIPMEDAAAAAPDGVRWYQLYWPTDDAVARSLVRRAEAAGYGAIVVTLDVPSLAWRPRDLTSAQLPFLRGTGLANFLSDPAFRAALAAPPEESHDALMAAVLHWIGMFANPGLSWHDLSRLRGWTDLPILVKGICHPDDARAALDAGVDGLVVSNHGGRQVDGARAAIDCLPEVITAVRAAGSDAPVLFDSGIRCGADILVALALGARAVLIGRLWTYGLILDGQAGVEQVLRYLLADLDLTMMQAGYSSIGRLSGDALVRVP